MSLDRISSQLALVKCRLAVVAWPRRAVASLTRAQGLARGQPCRSCTVQAQT